MVSMEAWPVPSAPYGCRGGVTGLLALYGPVEAWPNPWALYGRHEGVLGLLGPVWPPWGRGQSPGPRMEAVGRG